MPRDHFNHAVVVIGNSIFETASSTVRPLTEGDDQLCLRRDGKKAKYITRMDVDDNTITTYAVTKVRNKEVETPRMQVELRAATPEELHAIAKLAIGRKILLLTRRHTTGGPLTIMTVNRELRTVKVEVTKYAESLDPSEIQGVAPGEHKTSKSDARSLNSNAAEGDAPDERTTIESDALAEHKTSMSDNQQQFPFDELDSGEERFVALFKRMLGVQPQQAQAVIAAIKALPAW